MTVGTLQCALWEPCNVQCGNPAMCNVGTLQCALWEPCNVHCGNPAMCTVGTLQCALWEPCNVQWCAFRVKIIKQLSPLKVFSNFKIVRFSMIVGTLQCAMVCLQSKDYKQKLSPLKVFSLFKIVTDFQ